MKKLSKLLILYMSLSCNQQKSTPLMSAWDSTNDPNHFVIKTTKNEFEYHFDNLPTSGSIFQRPWSGDYWPSYLGGISYRWMIDSTTPEDNIAYNLFTKKQLLNLKIIQYLSPAEKLDIYEGNYNFPITQEERQRTNVLATIESQPTFDPDYEIPQWEGLCHAWAVTTLYFKNPNPVTLTNPDGIQVEFGSSDIKALLNYFVHKKPAQYFLLGGRCDLDFSELIEEFENGSLKKEEFEDLIHSKECLDTNAGSFHIVLANQIGLKKEGFIADLTRDKEVWNHPIYSYQSEILYTQNFPSKNAAKDTVKEIILQTKLHYVSEVLPTWQKHWQQKAYKTMTYHYRLELDNKGKILGGEWENSKNFQDRPDFIWKQKRPRFTSKFKSIQKIYQASR